MYYKKYVPSSLMKKCQAEIVRSEGYMKKTPQSMTTNQTKIHLKKKRKSYNHCLLAACGYAVISTYIKLPDVHVSEFQTDECT